MYIIIHWLQHKNADAIWAYENSSSAGRKVRVYEINRSGYAVFHCKHSFAHLLSWNQFGVICSATGIGYDTTFTKRNDGALYDAVWNNYTLVTKLLLLICTTVDCILNRITVLDRTYFGFRGFVSVEVLLCETPKPLVRFEFETAWMTLKIRKLFL